VAALLIKLSLNEGDLLVKQIVGLVNEANHGIGYDYRISMLEPGDVGIHVYAISPVESIITFAFPSDLTHSEGRGIVL